MVVGRCRLCLVTTNLCQSHVIPAFSFRRLREHGGQNATDPVHISVRDAFQTSDQLKAPLLCLACEQKIKRGGEDYVSRVVYRDDGDCPLFAAIGYTSKVVSLPHSTGGVDVPAPSVDVGAVAYFVLSVLWRASEAGGPRFGHYKLEDPVRTWIRLFLDGRASFPADVTVRLRVLDQPRQFKGPCFDGFVNFPMAHEIGPGWQRHSLIMNGFFFTVDIGPGVPPETWRACLTRRTDPVVHMVAGSHIPEMREAVASAARAIPRGRAKSLRLRKGKPVDG